MNLCWVHSRQYLQEPKFKIQVAYLLYIKLQFHFLLLTRSLQARVLRLYINCDIPSLFYSPGVLYVGASVKNNMQNFKTLQGKGDRKFDMTITNFQALRSHSK